ncbi:MAG TPA: DUF4093 domain-containing protein [Ruminococcaceae bacterium]|nr:DUF4093 domain-containing protein [Oscillospiraceae bacterium]
MIKLRQTVIVEGKYDKIALSNIIDATIIPTNGFSIFKDEQKRKLISILAKKNGIIIITDSDKAGMQIRSYLKRICPADSVKNVYIPQIYGKEKRKAKPSKEGFLGVEGMSRDVIVEALKKCNITEDNRESVRKLTKYDLYTVGMSGQTNSSLYREAFALYSGLPGGMSSTAFLDAVNAVYGADEFFKAVEKWKSEGDKN